MVSFVCDSCQETLKKPKLDQHKMRCRYAQYTCLDCNTTFEGVLYRQHTQCISEAEKYEKSLFKKRKVAPATTKVEDTKVVADATTLDKKKKVIEKVKSLVESEPISLEAALPKMTEKTRKRLFKMLKIHKTDGSLSFSIE